MLDAEGIRAEAAQSREKKWMEGNIALFGHQHGMTRMWVMSRNGRGQRTCLFVLGTFFLNDKVTDLERPLALSDLFP